jgi:hypothetical protein
MSAPFVGQALSARPAPPDHHRSAGVSGSRRRGRSEAGLVTPPAVIRESSERAFEARTADIRSSNHPTTLLSSSPFR